MYKSQAWQNIFPQSLRTKLSVWHSIPGIYLWRRGTWCHIKPSASYSSSSDVIYIQILCTLSTRKINQYILVALVPWWKLHSIGAFSSLGVAIMPGGPSTIPTFDIVFIWYRFHVPCWQDKQTLQSLWYLYWKLYVICLSLFLMGERWVEFVPL